MMTSAKAEDRRCVQSGPRKRKVQRSAVGGVSTTLVPPISWAYRHISAGKRHCQVQAEVVAREEMAMPRNHLSCFGGVSILFQTCGEMPRSARDFSMMGL